jgi:hypothetical protein
MRWAIVYADGSTYVELEDNDESRAVAPWMGVIAIVQDEPNEKGPCLLLHQEHNYWWRPDWGRWQSGDDFGWTQSAAMYRARYLKKGETVPTRDIRELMGIAVNLKQEWDKGRK